MFKKYDQNQQFLLPLSLDTFVPEDHIARIINDIIDAVMRDRLRNMKCLLLLFFNISISPV